jgi:hypothetical protein
VLLHEAIGVDDAEGIMGAAEGADLEEKGLVPGHVEAIEMLGLFARSYPVRSKQVTDR